MKQFVGRTAVELAALVQRGEATAEAVVTEHLRHARDMDAEVNAITVHRDERALHDAREVDRNPARGSLPLAGVPVVVKDSVDVAGELTRHGSRGGSTVPVLKDEASVARLRAAGAVVIAKTTMSELGAWPFTESKAWGWTRNPWCPDRSPGGSSGGCAVAVSLGVAPLGLAMDGGGSIRIPSSCCGIFGLKPGTGVVPLPAGHGSSWYGLNEEGPMATTVADAALMLGVLRGREVSLAAAEVPSTGGFSAQGHVRLQEGQRPLRVALSTRPALMGAALDSRIRDAVLATGHALEQAGHRVQRVDPPYPLWLALPFMRRWLAGVADQAEMLQPQWLESRTRQLAAIGRFLRILGMPGAQSVLAWQQRMNAWFGDFDVMLSPVVATPPPMLGAWGRRGLIGTFLATTRFMPYTPAWNLAGYPTASVPTGELVDKVPVGVQLVAPQQREDLLLSVAALIETLKPWQRHATPLGEQSTNLHESPRIDAN